MPSYSAGDKFTCGVCERRKLVVTLPFFQTHTFLLRFNDCFERRHTEFLDTLCPQRFRTKLVQDDKPMQTIPLVAIVDRSFQQRQLMSGGATQNISLSRIVAMAHELDVTPGAAALTAESSEEQ